MEVMNSGEFDQKDVLVGGSGKTGKFTVNDDPHLMSMLSTSLYANPLRTMIQEIMFNAWDAHRMGNCQDKPIDIYMNDTTGLIVRDYGPGIDPEMIDDIYCTYGASTKRQDDRQTGGFGLGSKSPYAYSDSFTVANHHDGKKSMYIMRRVHDDNDGGPGYDNIIHNVDTDQQGLLVTVPFKSENDKRRAYRYLKEILFLSGIKVNIHYDGKNDDGEVVDEETIEAESLAPGEFINCDMETDEIYAVYGGVKYKIPEHDEYIEEYKFLKKLTRFIGALYIGFPPNSLTPLPNREGLNMRERSVETIKTQLENIHEHFMTQMIPAVKRSMIEVLEDAKNSGLQTKFIFTAWDRVGDRGLNLESLFVNESTVITQIYDACPEGFNASTWISICKLVLKNTRWMTELVGYTKFNTLKALIWCKAFPDHKHWRHSIMQNSNVVSRNMDTNIRQEWASETIAMQEELKKITDQDCKIRVKVDRHSKWCILSRIRKAGKIDHLVNARQKVILQNLSQTKKLQLPTKEQSDMFWFQKDGNRFEHTMMDRTIIVAKTAEALETTEFNIQKYMVPVFPQRRNYQSWHYSEFMENTSVWPVAAMVIHKKKGQYDAAVQHLTDSGWHVIEADEPKPKVKAVNIESEVSTAPVRTGPPPMYVVNYCRRDWEGEEEVKKPSTYLYATKTQLSGYDRPYDEGFVQQVMDYAPKMVMIHNKRKADQLSARGVLSFEERVELIVDDLLSDKDRLRVMALHTLVYNESSLPIQIIAIPEMQKLMGLPYLRTRQREIFDRDRKFLSRFIENYNKRSYYHRRIAGVSRQLEQKVGQAFDKVYEDDSVVLVRKMIKHTSVFDSQALGNLAFGMKPGEQKMLAQKIARFLRTV